MKVTLERLPESQVRLDITAEDAEFNEAVERAYRKISRDVLVPGFRKGKAPRHMIERIYGRELFVEEANRGLMDSLFRKAIEQEEIVPVGDPAVEVVAPEPLQFAVTIAVYPTADPGDYVSARVEPIDAAIEESQVDEVIERLRVQSSPWEDPAEPRKPRDGDQVTVDLAISDEEHQPFQEPAQDAVFILGESQLFDALRAAIEDLDVGETADTTILFEEDDEQVNERLRGKQLTYNVTLKSLKERQLLPMDDTFAETYGAQSTMDELRTSIRADLHRGRTNEARGEVLEQIITTISEGATIEIPATMIDESVDQEVERMRTRLSYQRTTLESYLRASDQTEDELKAELRPSVAQRLRNSIVLREISEREGIAVDDDELDREIDVITRGAPDPVRLRQVYGGDRYMRSVLRNDLFDRRLSDRLIEIATEGRGATLNGWVEPEVIETEASESDIIEIDGEGNETVEIAAPSGEREQEAVGDETVGFAQAASDGSCPDSHPVKGNADSMIYHTLASRSYDTTEAEICFLNESEAESAGYRAPQDTPAS